MQILAHRLNQILGEYIGQDQTGFVKKSYLGDSIRWLMNLSEQVHENKSPILFYFIHAYKAFDRVDWTFMKTVLAKMGMGNLFV